MQAGKMKYRSVILVAAAVICLSAATIGIFQHRITIHPVNSPLIQTYIDMQNPINVVKLDVLTGSEFDLGLADNRRIHAVLEVKASHDATKHVLEFLNRCKNPRVVLKQQSGEVWVVQLFVTTQDATGQIVEIDLAKWLKDKKLAYD
jgi:hypothetical protein